MEQIPTAKEFCRKRHNESDPTISWIDFNEMVMVEFAKLHVEAALKEASENAKASLGKDWISRKEQKIHPGQLVDTIIIKVDKDSILNSYPLTNIK
jgi:hypothetical protein